MGRTGRRSQGSRTLIRQWTLYRYVGAQGQLREPRSSTRCPFWGCAIPPRPYCGSPPPERSPASEAPGRDREWSCWVTASGSSM